MRRFMVFVRLITASIGILFPALSRAQTPVALGISAPLTGPFAIYGHQVADGARLAVDTINSHGGIGGRRIEAIVVDDEGQIATAAASARKMIVQDKVAALIGYPLSPEAQAVKQVAESAKVLMITLATAPELTADRSESVLRVIGRADSLAMMVADYISVNFGARNLGVQYSAPAGAFNVVLQRELSAKNLTVKQSETSSFNVSQPPAWVHTVQAIVGPFGISSPTWITGLARENRDLRIIAPQVVVSGEPSKLIEGLPNVTIISNPWPGFFPTARPIVVAARERGEDPNGYFLYGYAAVQVFASAIEHSGGHISSPDLFAAARTKEGVETALGRVSFSGTGDLVAWHFAVLSASGGPPDVCQLPAAQCRKYDSCPRDCPTQK